ncbi:hypothetical protein PRZ61_10870 [Halomonas pacifica]|uniref:hypothetical protein n=1 Tax=Bisbaumannia pacifica TaxID=77098 RepID=UPI00235919D1|nr:hypothetical protein [Halomonas pacifica]MDC8803938.1 hypothetical protein [Halomonas pacifica]
MTARDEIQSELAEAFSRDDELGQAYFPFTAVRTLPGGGAWNPDTATFEPATESYTGHYWRSKFTFAEIQSLDLDSADLKIGILSNATEKVPAVDDVLTLDGGRAARVIEISPDPLGATYSVRLRIN